MANINAPGQIVIAGHRAAVERAVKAAAARGGRRSVMLPVSAPFHCALMKPAADRARRRRSSSVAVARPRVPVVRNVDAGLTTEADDVKPFLVRQVASPVRWTDCVERLRREGAEVFLEVGPGRVLTGLLKRTLDGARSQAVEDPASLDKAVALAAGGRAVSEAKALAGRVAVVTGGSRGIGARHRPLPGRGRGLRGSLWARRGPTRRCRRRRSRARGRRALAVAADVAAAKTWIASWRRRGSGSGGSTSSSTTPASRGTSSSSA